MKAVLISIRPQWCELIASRKKTIEVRKTRPKLDTPFKVYIYCTKDKHGWFDFGKKERLDGKVIGEFVCNHIEQATVDRQRNIAEAACLSLREIWKYAGETSAYDLFGWHISDLVIYDKPRDLNAFEIECKGGCDIPYLYEPPCARCGKNKLTRPPQSWCYVEEL